MTRLLPCLLLLSACATTPVPVRSVPDFADLDSLDRVDPARYPHAPIVVLDHAEEITLHWKGELSRTTIVSRVAMQVTSAEGVKQADVKLQVPDGVKFEIAARTITPSGGVREVTASQVHEETAWIGQTKVKYRVFRFPEAEVGSILELVARAQARGLLPSYLGSLASTYPTRHRTLRVRFEGYLRYDFRTYNLRGQHATHTSGAGAEQLVLSLDDIPASADEPLSSPWQARDPWWAFRVTQIPGFPRLHSWAEVFGAMVQVIDAFADKREEGLDLARATAGCGAKDARCIVEAALRFAREKTELTEFGGSGVVANLQEGLRTHRLDSFGKAVLLDALLRGRVQARYAFVLRATGRALDEGFPYAAAFDHVVLYLPAQPGLPEPLFVDPSCESCQLGQHPVWLAGRRALVVSHTPQFARPEAEFIDVPDANVPNVAVLAESHDVTLDETGGVDDHYQATALGEAAVIMQLLQSAVTGEALRKAAQELATSRAANAEVLEVSKLSCDKRAAKCDKSVHFRAAGFAPTDGDKIFVPLALLAKRVKNSFEEPVRRTSFFVGSPARFEEVLKLRLPDGYEVAELPKPVARRIPIAEFSLESAVEGRTVVIRRRYALVPGQMPRTASFVVRLFFQELNRARGESVVLRRTAP